MLATETPAELLDRLTADAELLAAQARACHWGEPECPDVQDVIGASAVLGHAGPLVAALRRKLAASSGPKRRAGSDMAAFYGEWMAALAAVRAFGALLEARWQPEALCEGCALDLESPLGGLLIDCAPGAAKAAHAIEALRGQLRRCGAVL